MNNTVPATRRASPFQFAIVLIALLFSLLLIYQGLFDYLSGGDTTTAGFYMSLGAIFLLISTYTVLQTRRRLLRLMSMEMPTLSTALECQKCGLKNIREFQRGDFVFKQTDQPCPKDNQKMIISAIYRETPEKAKEEANR